MVWQFFYAHRVVEISLLLRKKKYKMLQYSFISQQQHENPNLQNNSFSILCTGFTMDYKKGQQIFKIKTIHYIKLRFIVKNINS